MNCNTGAERARKVPIALSLLALAAGCASAFGENTRSITQGLVSPSAVTVSAEDQRELGLVNVGGGCSGTLLNRYWVLTADHCVTSDATIGGPPANLSALRVTAAWSIDSPTPTAVVRYATTTAVAMHSVLTGQDVALLFLGKGDFGPVRTQLFYVQPVEPGTQIASYGMGINQMSGIRGSLPAPTPSRSDGAYRVGIMLVASAAEHTYSVLPNEFGQIPSGGDSGGPDIVKVKGSSTSLGIAGVHSTCSYEPQPGYTRTNTPADWAWAKKMTACVSAAIGPIRDDIVRKTQETPIPGSTAVDVGGRLQLP